MAELQVAIETAELQLKGIDNDNKIHALQALEQQLHNTEPSCIQSQTLDAAVSVSKAALKNGNPRVYSSALSCTVALFSILEEQCQASRGSQAHGTRVESGLRHAISALVPSPGGLLSFLGDAKDAIRTIARSALLQAGKASCAVIEHESKAQPDQSGPTILDKLVKEQGFASKNAKVREQSLLYLAELREACPHLPLRGWAAILVHALEDSDPNVRDTARESVIAIFTAPQVGATARADLKKELLKQNVRKTMSDAILKRILGNTGHLPASSSNAANSATSVSFVHSDDATSNGRQSPSLPSVLPPRPTSVASKHRSSSPNFIPRPSVGKGSTDPSIAKARGGDRLLKQPKDLTQAEILADIEAVAAAHAESASPAVAAVLEPVYVASARDLEHEFASMQPCFVGKETEFNWQDREKSIFRMRGMLLGGVHLAYKSAFIACIKSMVDNILKAVSTLRTTLAIATCQLLSELTEALKEGLAPMFEPIFSGLLKLASLTKKSVASASQDAVALMLRRCTYHPKILPLLASTLDQKSIQARTYAARHLKDFVEVQCPAYKDAVEGTPAAGLPLLTSMVKKELADPSTAVRDYGRATYWLVDGLWPDSGQAILQTLDSAARKGLERNGSRHAAGIFHAESLAASSSSKPTPGRPSMRELISSRRAAQVAATPRTTRLANPASTMPESTAPTSTISATEANSQNSPASPSQKPRLSADNEATPVKMGAVTSSGPSVSHIPSPTRRTQHSPRSRVSSGNASKASFGGGENALRHSSAAVEEQPDPTAATSMRKAMKVLPGGSLFTSSDSRLSQKHQPRRSRSSSPELSLPKGVADYSDIEASTFNAMPDGLDSTDDESLNIINYNPPTQDMRVAIDVDTSEQSRILDSLMDTTISLNDNAEIEEAVKGRAEQAEQAAHRFLELAESDYDEQNVSAADTTVLAQHEATSSDIPVPYTPNGKLVNHPGLPEASSYASQFEKKDSVASDATPLLLRLQALQLQDSPAGKAAPSALLQRVSIQDHWWMAKADLIMAKAAPESDRSKLLHSLTEAIDIIGQPNHDSDSFISLARTSKALAVEQRNENSNAAAWLSDGLYDRACEAICDVLRQKHTSVTFEASVALYQLIKNQAPLVDGKELKFMQLLFALSGDDNKVTRAGSEVILSQLASSIEPLYGLSCLRLCLETASSQTIANTSANQVDESTVSTFSMGLRAMGDILSDLPSEVLDEEITRCRDIILKGMNSSKPALRQTAATVIVRVYAVIEDEARLFELLGGLSQTQRNLCAYLFARSRRP